MALNYVQIIVCSSPVYISVIEAVAVTLVSLEPLFSCMYLFYCAVYGQIIACSGPGL